MRGRKLGSGVYSVPIKINFPPDLLDALKGVAKARNTSVSEIIRECARIVVDPEAQVKAIFDEKDEDNEFGAIWGEVEKHLSDEDRSDIDEIMYGGDTNVETIDETEERHQKAKTWLLEKSRELKKEGKK